MQEKYQFIKVLRDVYCNSAGELFFKVWITEDNKNLNITYSNNQFTRGEGNTTNPVVMNLPQQLQATIELTIMNMIEQGAFQPYEVDEDDNARFGSFRYFKPRLLWRKRNDLAEQYGIEQKATGWAKGVGSGIWLTVHNAE